ncbi:MAG: outer membrane beta-barrel protein [Chitinophagales bacterium]
MKNRFLFLALLAFTKSTFAISDKIRLGVHVSPGVAWMQAEGKDLVKGPAAFGLQYGLTFEYYFKDKNYAFVTGLSGGMEGGALQGRDYFMKYSGGRSVLEKYSSQSVTLPIYIKLKTNEIQKFHLFGQVGFDPVFMVYARGTYNQTLTDTLTGVSVDITKENLLRNGNDVSKIASGFHYNYFDIRLGVIAGFEYDFSEKTSLLVSVGYHNGFLNMIHDSNIDSKKDPVLMRNFLFGIGVMF